MAAPQVVSTLAAPAFGTVGTAGPIILDDFTVDQTTNGSVVGGAMVSGNRELTFFPGDFSSAVGGNSATFVRIGSTQSTGPTLSYPSFTTAASSTIVDLSGCNEIFIPAAASIAPLTPLASSSVSIGLFDGSGGAVNLPAAVVAGGFGLSVDLAGLAPAVLDQADIRLIKVTTTETVIFTGSMVAQ